MKKKIEISDNENGTLSVNLNHILSCIDEIELYKWKILWLTGVGKSENTSTLELEAKINNSESGYLISHEDLLKFNDSFYQIIELILIGDRDFSKLKRYKDDEETRNLCNYYIELVDSSCWEISVDDQKMIDNIISKFKHVETI